MNKQIHTILLLIWIVTAPVISFTQNTDSIPKSNNIANIDMSHSLFNNIVLTHLAAKNQKNC